MSEVAIFNPGKKRRRGKKRRSAKQKAATRRMIAARWGKKVSRRARVNPGSPRRRRRRGNPVTAMNPRRRRRGNPARGFGGLIQHTIIPSATGALGAIGVDIVLNMVPLPAMLQQPMIKPVVRIAGAIGVGWLGGMVMGRRFGDQMTAGAVTVVLYDTLKGFLRPMFPAALAEYSAEELGWSNPAVVSEDTPALTDEGMSVYDESMGVYTDQATY